MSDRPITTGGPATEAIQTQQRQTWIRGIVVGVFVAILLVLVGWIGGSIANVLARTPAEVAYDELRDAPDSTSRSIENGDVFLALHWKDDRAVLVARGLPELGEDQEIAVWYGEEGDERPDRITDFVPAEDQTILVLPSKWEEGDIVSLTVDPQGGTSSGRPAEAPLVQIAPE